VIHRKGENLRRQAQAHVMRRLEARFGKIHHEKKPARCYVPQGILLGELPLVERTDQGWNGVTSGGIRIANAATLLALCKITGLGYGEFEREYAQ
jgi:hypothetical protein